MERIAASLFPSLIWLRRMCFLVYVVLAVASLTSSSAEINEHNGGKASYTKQGSDLVKDSMKSTISLHQRGNSKVDGGRNHSASESAMINDERNSAALNRFLENVLRARNDFKWIDHAARPTDRRARLIDPYTDEYSAGSVNVEEVLGRADIGYGSRLRGKRGFDRNYETMWMLRQKKKYGAEDTRDVPQRVYRDNGVTFRRDSDGVDFDAPDRSRDTLDRAFYERGAMADQPLKDWARKKDLRSSADWPNSNENPEIGNVEAPWFRDSDSRKNGDKLYVDADTRDPPEIVSLYGPTHADDFTALRESSVAIRNGKSQDTPLSLESLKKTVLELKNSLTLRNKKENTIIPREKSNWWDDSRSAVEVFDLVRRDLDDRPNEETIWRIKRAKSAGNENDSGLNIPHAAGLEGSYTEERNLKESHDRSKRSRRSSFVISDNQTSIHAIKDNIENVTKTQTHSPRDIVTSETPRTSRREISQRAEAETTPKTVGRTAADRANSFDFEMDPPVSNASTNSIRLSTSTDDSRESVGRTEGIGVKLGVAAGKVSRRGADDGRSKGAGEDFPRGNTSRGIGSATNESRDSSVVETDAAVKAAETYGTREENREPIPGVIKNSEAEGRPDEERGAGMATRLSRQTGEPAEKMRTSGVDESRNANAKVGPSSSPIDLVDDARMTARPDVARANTFRAGESITSSDRHDDDLAPIIPDNDSREQQMVPSVGAVHANRSGGNSDADEIDIRAPELNENGTMNVKEDIRTVIKPREYREYGNNLQRRLLWISASRAADESRKRSEMITTGSPNPSEIKRREDNIETSRMLQIDLNSHVSDANRYARHKRSTYSRENLEPDSEVDPENVAIEKEAPINPDEKQEDNEEYPNQCVEGLVGNYNDREETIEEKDRAMANEREGRSLSDQGVDPVKSKVNMLIKQRLDTKSKDSGDYRRKKRNTLGTIEYHDYDGDEEQETRDALVNQQEIKDANDKQLSAEDNVKVKRDGKAQSCKPGDLGEKKNENAEAAMKEEREKARSKNKEPKEEFIVDLGEPKNKTVQSDRNDRKPTDSRSGSDSGSSFEDAFKGEEQWSAVEKSGKIRQSVGGGSNIYHEEAAADTKSKRLDEPSGNTMASYKNSKSALEDGYKKSIALAEPTKYISKARVDADPDVIEKILLDIQPTKVLEQSRGFEMSKGFYEDFENERPEDRYYYQENDRSHPNEESLYEELRKIYDWPDDELKSGPRLRGDQRLRYESDDKLDTKTSRLQPLDDRFFGTDQNDDAQRAFHLADVSRTTMGSNSTPSSYIALKITDNILKGGLEQSSSTKENSPNISVIVESRMFKIAGIKNSSVPEGSVGEGPVIDTETGSPYENRKYIESEMRRVLKRNFNSEKQAAINTQDLRESFVESLEWRDDLDDTANVRLGRGLKAVDGTLIFDSNKIHDQDNKPDVANATDVNSENRDYPRTFHNNTSPNRHDNATTNLINTPDIRHDVADNQSIKRIQETIPMNMIDTDEDLEGAEQKYTDHQTPRIRRAAASYRGFYDDVSPDQRDSDEADGSVDSRLQSPNILEDRADSAYRGYAAPNWNNDLRDLGRYSKMSRNTDSRKREKAGTKSKKKKKKKKKKKNHSAKNPEKHARKGSHSSLSSQRSRRHHTRRSDTSRNANRKMRKKKKKKEKDEASRSAGRSTGQKSKMTDRELIRAGMNEASGERVLYENAEDQSTVKPEVDDARRKEITLLLAADDVDDESQMDTALHGELAGKIVEQIFEQVQKNDQLKSAFGPGLYRDYKTEDAITTSNTYRQGLDEDGTNHTETTMRRVMELLGRLILNEVQRKTCVSLSPDMREFLGWMLGVDRDEESLEEAPPLPLVREEIVPEEDTGRKFLFDSNPRQEGEEDISDLQKKVRVLETLVKEYNALTARERTKVQTVYDYLIRQLNLLLRYIEAREAAETRAKSASISTGAARAGTGSILQYQSALPNATNASYPMAFLSPIDKHNLFRFDNDTFRRTDKQQHDSRAASRHRETRSLDQIPSKQGKRKRRKGKRQRNVNRGKPKRRRHREHRDRRTESLPDYKRSRRKRADPDENHHESFDLGYAEPTIYDSFDVLDAKLTGERKERKRELADKGNVETGDGGTVDLLPIKGKNRLEDEVILLNKREAWRRENEEQLEEVAFGKDMRNSAKRERKRFEKLTEGDKREPIDETRTKREDIVNGTTTSANRSGHSHTTSAIDESRKHPETTADNNDNGATGEDQLRLVERKINVFADNETAAAIDIAETRINPGEKAAINPRTDNRVKGKLRAINRETETDNADGGTSFVNLTSDTKPRVSQEQRKVSEAERVADGNAVKLNRATNYQSEKIDPEIELKNLERPREKDIYGVADTKNSIYDDDNLSTSKLREKYTAKLDEPGDLDTDIENNMELLRLRDNKRPSDVVEWKITPVIKGPSYYDDRALSRPGFAEKETPVLNGIKNVIFDPDAYLNNPTLWRLRHRGGRNGVFNITPLRVFDDSDCRSFPSQNSSKSETSTRTGQ